ncbi:unnamed protein product [Xylocopa violacea]|uniref:Uncharacterized protein n=1 Tax=Xylocopa violacea TaxID=135666 RepID=A0ABP1N4D0_XYLVO
MERKFYFFSWILLMKILQPMECSNMDPITASTSASNTSNVNAKTDNLYLTKSDNERVYFILRNGSSSTITVERPLSSSKRSKLPPTESSILNIAKFVSKYSKNDTNEKGSQEELIKNSILESWYRVKRDDEDAEYTKLYDFNDSDQGTITDDSFQNNDEAAKEEETEDSLNNNLSNEEYSNPAEWSTPDVKDGEEEDTRSWKEDPIESRSRNGVEDRHWFGYKREPHHNFIRIPIFSGK